MKPQQRVLVVCQHFWPEAFRINDICDYLVEKDCQVEVLCGMPNYPKGQLHEGYTYFKNLKQHHDGVEIHRAWEIPRGNNSNLRIFLNYISFPVMSLFHVPRLLLKKYDRILLYQLSPVMMSVAGIIVGKLKHVKTTMYVLDLWPENLFSVLDVKQPWLRRIAEWVSHWHYRNVDQLVVLSERMRSRLLEVTDLPEEKIIVLPQACEKLYEVEDHDDELRRRFRDKGGFNIVFTGNISPAQSFETVIAAAKELKTAGLHDVRWVIVGDGMSRKWLEGEVKAAGLDDSFVFEGFKPMTDIPKYSDVADALLGCLVKSELLEATIPAKVMSYFALGRPVVLAMDGEVRELVNETIRCGLAGPTNDAHALAENIKQLHGMTPKEREVMGRRGREYHLKHFERNIIVGKLFRFLFS